MTLRTLIEGYLTAKFHCTGPIGPDQTKSADFVGDPRGPSVYPHPTVVQGVHIHRVSVT